MDALELIKSDEGLRLKPYKCTAGKATIGYGRNLDDRGITKSEADYLFQNDIADSTVELQYHIPYFDDLSEVRQAVLLNMSFNLGWTRLSRFVNFLDALRVRDYETASAEMLNSRWAKQVASRAHRLANMMRSNEWPEGLEWAGKIL